MLCLVRAEANHEFHLFATLIYYYKQILLPALAHRALPQSLKHFWQNMRIRTRLLDTSEAFSLNGANLLRVFYPMIPKVFPNRTPGGKKQSDGQMMDKG